MTTDGSGSLRRGMWRATSPPSPCRGRGLWTAAGVPSARRGSVPHRGARHRRVGVAGAIVLVAVCLTLAGCQRPVAPSGREGSSSTRTAGRGSAGQPVSIAIPAVGIDARVVPVGLRADRTMEVPEVDLAGWYEPGPRPGEAGPAVIVGHVDSRHGAAVFFRLGELRPGNRITVGQQGGAARSFLVERVERSPKEALPAGPIWDRTRRPVLRLITCGGSFDRSTGHYRDNVVVYASAAT